MNHKTYLFCLLATTIFLSGCCTILLQGSKQKVTITSNEAGANVKIDGELKGVTPLSIKLKKKKIHTIEVSKEGFRQRSAITIQGSNPLVFLNILNGILPGMIVDLSTGASIKFDKKYILDLEKLPTKPEKGIPLVCNYANFKIAPGTNIGTIAGTPISWDNTINVQSEDLIVLVNNEMSNLGYPVSGAEGAANTAFNKEAKLYIQASIIGMNITVDGNVKCDLKIIWKLKKIANGDVIYEKEISHPVTEQASDDKKHSIVILEAFTYSLYDFLKDPKTIDAISEKQLAISQSTGILQIERPAYKEGIKTIEAIASESSASVVTIETGMGHGSGFIVSPDGYVLTNYHVIEGHDKVNVIFSNNFSFIGKVIKYDEVRDIALVKVEGNGFKPLMMADSVLIKPGTDVIAIGTPEDKNLSQTVTKGIISGNRLFNDKAFIQTDVAINPGNSGGPLIDRNGKVVGVVTAKISGQNIQGLGFAIPITDAIKALNISYR